MKSKAYVYIVDDDESVRGGLIMQLEAAGLRVEAFASAEDFLAAISSSVIGTLLLDVRMPGMTGPELQIEMARRNIPLPVIFLSGYGDIPLAVKCIQGGAWDFLTKPVSGDLLVQRVLSALQYSLEQWEKGETDRLLKQKMTSLTGRESEVLALALTGHANKEIAKALGISVRTVEHHRSRILLKTGVDNLFKLPRYS